MAAVGCGCCGPNLSHDLASDMLEPEIVNVWPGVAPGSEGATQAEIEHELGGAVPNLVVRNVTQPTLTAYLPKPAKATGAAVLVAPGGGFRMLSIATEGHQVARWLAARGVAAFVLKYRLLETPASQAAFGQQMIEFVTDLQHDPRMRGAAFGERMIATGRHAIADASQALNLIRRRSKQWHIDQNRLGMLGFSAGGFAASGVLFDADSTHPDFAGLIYGAGLPEGAAATPSLPPLFVAVSADDFLVGETVFDFSQRLRAANVSHEFHAYRRGGHGWGMNVQGLSSDHWIEEFYWWIEDLGVLRRL
jgi:acetyl esterase/lipase